MRKLGEEDRQQLLEYVGKEPEMNLFFIGDIESYGIDTEEVSIYVQEDERGWDCVLLRFFDFYLVYSQREQYQAKLVARFLEGKTVDCFSGKTELVKQLAPFYPGLNIQETLMCRCDRSSLLRSEEMTAKTQAENIKSGQPRASAANIRRLTAADSPEIMRLYLQIEEFAAGYRQPQKAEEQLRADLENGELAVGLFENGRLVSVAKTSASNSVSSMIVGVATAPEARKRGYASVVIKALCSLAFEGKREFLCLFYDNPEAGRIYRRMGFLEIGSYSMMR